MKDIYAGLGLTEDEIEIVKKYKALIMQKARATRFKRYYAEVEAHFPGVDSETRESLAERLYSEEMGRAAKRSYPNGGA